MIVCETSCSVVWLDDRVNGDFVSHTNDNNSWKNGRQLLRQWVSSHSVQLVEFHSCDTAVFQLLVNGSVLEQCKSGFFLVLLYGVRRPIAVGLEMKQAYPYSLGPTHGRLLPAGLPLHLTRLLLRLRFGFADYCARL